MNTNPSNEDLGGSKRHKHDWKLVDTYVSWKRKREPLPKGQYMKYFWYFYFLWCVGFGAFDLSQHEWWALYVQSFFSLFALLMIYKTTPNRGG